MSNFIREFLIHFISQLLEVTPISCLINAFIYVFEIKVIKWRVRWWAIREVIIRIIFLFYFYYLVSFFQFLLLEILPPIESFYHIIHIVVDLYIIFHCLPWIEWNHFLNVKLLNWLHLWCPYNSHFRNHWFEFLPS